jgi:hypothetical protein
MIRAVREPGIRKGEIFFGPLIPRLDLVLKALTEKAASEI